MENTETKVIQEYEDFHKELQQRVHKTGWEASFAYGSNLKVYHCIIRKKDSQIPTLEERRAGIFPLNYFQLESRDFTTIQLAIDQVLKAQNL